MLSWPLIICEWIGTSDESKTVKATLKSPHTKLSTVWLCKVRPKSSRDPTKDYKNKNKKV